MGAKTTYTPERGELILAGLAEGKSLRAVCQQEGMPSVNAVLGWVEDFPEFGAHYTRVRARAYQMLADEILEISDDSNGDVLLDENGVERTDTERVARAKLRVDSRKWMLSKMLPKIYGDKLDVNHSGEPVIVVRDFTGRKKADE